MPGPPAPRLRHCSSSAAGTRSQPKPRLLHQKLRQTTPPVPLSGRTIPQVQAGNKIKQFTCRHLHRIILRTLIQVPWHPSPGVSHRFFKSRPRSTASLVGTADHCTTSDGLLAALPALPLTARQDPRYSSDARTPRGTGAGPHRAAPAYPPPPEGLLTPLASAQAPDRGPWGAGCLSSLLSQVAARIASRNRRHYTPWEAPPQRLCASPDGHRSPTESLLCAVGFRGGPQALAPSDRASPLLC
ncbi:hypothetical protein NDU88_002661 [Pleurodeles waltl]|uniref:Uncharacterized protein n=1 Tax=Pleurodeles waltl TaxID=8319 RepID=A0AAV7TLR3_PLEWA|nr:hypothetical protein NDU88_002661 [Pleurodeles waltl]